MSLDSPKHIISKLTPDEYEEDGQEFLVTLPTGEMLAEKYRWNALHEHLGDQTDMYDIWCELKGIITDPSKQYYLLRMFAECIESKPYESSVAKEALDIIAPVPLVRSSNTAKVLEYVHEMYCLLDSRDSNRSEYDEIADALYKYIDDNNDDNAVIILGSYALAIYGYDTLETVGALLTHARSQAETEDILIIDKLFHDINSGEMFIDMPPMSLLFDTGHHMHILNDLSSLSESDDESNLKLNEEWLVEINNKDISSEQFTILDSICIASLCNIALLNSSNESVRSLRTKIVEYGSKLASAKLYDRDQRVLENLATK